MENEPLPINAKWALEFTQGALVETTVDGQIIYGRRDQITGLVDPTAHNLITAAIREAFQQGRVPKVTRTILPSEPMG